MSVISVLHDMKWAGNSIYDIFFPTATLRQEQPICLHTSTNSCPEERFHVWSPAHAETPDNIL